MIKYIRSVALHLLRKHIVKQLRNRASMSWSAINKVLMALELGQMDKTAMLDGKTKVYFKDGETMIVDGMFDCLPVKVLK